MPILTITTDDGKEELVRVRIADIDPAQATIAILSTLAKVKPPRATRKDAGQERGPRKAAVPNGKEVPA